MTPHVHAELIKAWADGAEIERDVSDRLVPNYWMSDPNPNWLPSSKYRIKDPYRELKEAAVDPTKPIRAVMDSVVLSDWKDAGYSWAFNMNPECYEIRDKPKQMKKMKLLCWFTGTTVIWRTEGAWSSASWERVPSEDKEIEVEE
jgi:hypothetical protein